MYLQVHQKFWCWEVEAILGLMTDLSVKSTGHELSMGKENEAEIYETRKCLK